MHSKYEVSISYGSKVIANVKVDNRQTNKQTGQKQYAPDHSIQGHKKIVACKVFALKYDRLWIWYLPWLILSQYTFHVKVMHVPVRASHRNWQMVSNKVIPICRYASQATQKLSQWAIVFGRLYKAGYIYTMTQIRLFLKNNNKGIMIKITPSQSFCNNLFQRKSSKLFSHWKFLQCLTKQLQVHNFYINLKKIH